MPQLPMESCEAAQRVTGHRVKGRQSLGCCCRHSSVPAERTTTASMRNRVKSFILLLCSKSTPLAFRGVLRAILDHFCDVACVVDVNINILKHQRGGLLQQHRTTQTGRLTWP